MFEKFKEWYEKRHEYAKDWKKRTGGKVIGYFCTYTPEEVIYAAGMLPVRVLGSHEPEDVSAPYIHSMWCPFSHDVLAQGLKGRYDYLDGIVMANSCMHMRQAFSAWREHVPSPFSFFVSMPSKVHSPRAKPYLVGELTDLKTSLEKLSGKAITDADLERAIGLVNKNRRLMKEIYELRKADKPPLTGIEAMYMVVSAQLTDKAAHSAELEKLLPELRQRKTARQPGTRLMLIGSENDDVTFVNLLESFDATVVIDESCTGSRYFWNEVIPDKDKLGAIASRYLDRPRCPVKDWEARVRFDHILKLAKDYNVRGVVLYQQKFCDPHELDMVPLRKMLEENGFPCYMFELDITVPVGQFRIRFEAFLEMLKADELPF